VAVGGHGAAHAERSLGPGHEYPRALGHVGQAVPLSRQFQRAQVARARARRRHSSAP
jgi:hypothetical protein